MVAAAAARAGAAGQTLIVDLQYPTDAGVGPFTRADLVFAGVDNSGPSYEVRIFLNNPEATADTPRDAEHGYAGRFSIFGHGGCYGDDDSHCRPASGPRLGAPPMPQTTFVTVTESLRRVLAESGALRTVTLVPVAITPRRGDRGAAPDLLRFADVSLQTYLSATDADVPQPA